MAGMDMGKPGPADKKMPAMGPNMKM